MTIYTAGYGNRGFLPFVDLMKRYGVTHLVDVRSVPQSSYWEDFRRENLEVLVPPTGLRYIYMGDTLGGVRGSPVLCKDPGVVEIDPLFDRPEFQLGLDRLVAAAAPPRVICLMCGCLRPHRCHRSRLIGEALLARGIELQHLDDKGNPVGQRQVMLESPNSQLALF